MTDKTKDKIILNNIQIINNMEKIKLLNDWDTKISLINETKEMINNEKTYLLRLKNIISNNDYEDNDIEFGKMDLDKVISKIYKNKNLEDKVKKLQLLKLWIKQQKNKVIKNES